MNAETRIRVQALISDFMGRWVADSISAEELERITVEGVSPSGLLTPFHDALVPGITLLGERSFSTRLGNLHERITAVVAAESTLRSTNHTTSREPSRSCHANLLRSAFVLSSGMRLSQTRSPSAIRSSATLALT
jgi:hypothetical protein